MYAPLMMLVELPECLSSIADTASAEETTTAAREVRKRIV